MYCTTWDWKSGLGDAQGIIDLYKQWTGERRFPENILNKWTIVAKDENKIVGAAELLLVDDWVWHRRWGLVENVYVEKDSRKKGIGKMMMEHVEAQAKGWGCEFIKLTSRKKEGKTLYRSLGYEEGSCFRKELR